jgi:class 3 adenylate cyclase
MASHEQQPIRRLACARGLIGRASCYGLGNLMGPAERSGIADMAQPKVERRLAAILAMDVVGYARLMEAHEADTLTDLRAHRTELIEPSTAEHGGRIVKLMGDGILVEFPSAVEAVQCAVDVQRGMARRNAEVAAERRIEFRIGINLGDVVVDGATTSMAMVSTSPLASKVWPSRAPSASPATCSTRSGTRSSWASGIWASSGSRTSPSRSPFMGSCWIRRAPVRCSDRSRW